jgi:hypothetical protein
MCEIASLSREESIHSFASSSTRQLTCVSCALACCRSCAHVDWVAAMFTIPNQGGLPMSKWLLQHLCKCGRFKLVQEETMSCSQFPLLADD